MEGLSDLDFYHYDIPAHTAATWETNEIPAPSDMDLEKEAIIVYAIEFVPRDSATLFADGSEFVFPFTFHLTKPSSEDDLDTCFLTKIVSGIRDAGANMFFSEGNSVPIMPIVAITSIFEACNAVADAIVAGDMSFRIWYDDVPLNKSQFSRLVQLLRGEQV